jgi:hypothetical protein
MKKRHRGKRQRPPDAVAKPGRRVDELAQAWLTPEELRDSDSIVVVSGTYGHEAVDIRLEVGRLKAIALRMRRLLVVLVSVGAGWGWGTHQVRVDPDRAHEECKHSEATDESG